MSKLTFPISSLVSMATEYPQTKKVLFIIIRYHKHLVFGNAVLNIRLLQILPFPVVYYSLLRERRGTPVLLSASVSDNCGNSPQIAAPRRSHEIDQSTQRFHVGCDNRCLLGNEYGRLHGREFLGRTLIFTG